MARKQIKPPTLTAERARELLNYDEATGDLRWKQTLGSRARAGNVAGSLKDDGRLAIRLDKRLYLAHRVIWLMLHGSWPTHQIDHVRQVPLDNTPDGIRDVPDAINKQNIEKARRDNASGYRGVHFDKRRGTYVPSIKVDGKHVHLGSFKTGADASLVYLAAKASLHPGWVNRNAVASNSNHSINSTGLRRARSDSTSGLTGATPCGGRWRSGFGWKKRKIYLGMYDTAEIAHARHVEAKELVHLMSLSS